MESAASPFLRDIAELAIRHLPDRASGTPVAAVGGSEVSAEAGVDEASGGRNAYAASSIAKIAVSG